jgi:ferredoxin-type protein NapF
VLPEAEFLRRCTRCDDCVTVCPETVIHRGSGGYPEVSFERGPCTFCGDCAAACKAGAFREDGRLGVGAFAHRAAVGKRCLASNGVVCRACGDHCEAGAIRFRLALGGRSHPAIDAARCIGCGACVAVCPVQAVTLQAVESAEAAA